MFRWSSFHATVPSRVFPRKGAVMTDVSAWLEARVLSQLKLVFAEHDLDCEILRHLTDADLKELGLSLGLRKKLLNAIASDASRPKDNVAKSAVITPTTEISPAHAAERRQLTVMFCDLKDSTALSNRLDPEELHHVLQSYHACCANAVRRFGGYIAKYLGDGSLICFGFPHAHEDDAERAVHAALVIVKTVSQLRPQADLALHVRIGIATGLVV